MDTKELSALLMVHPWQLQINLTLIPVRIDNHTKWPAGSHHFQCAISRVGFGPAGHGKSTAFFFEYSKGPAHKPRVSLAELMYTLLQDARVPEDYRDEWEMAEEFGMEVKSKADYLHMVNMYAQCQETADWLKRTFTPQEREQLEEMFQDF